MNEERLATAGLESQNHLQRAVVGGDHFLEGTLGEPVEAALPLFGLVFEEAPAHHRCQRQRDYRRDQNGHAQRHRELAEQAAHDIAHE
jgi:hypothetical protein